MQNENVFFTTDKYSNLTDEQIISQIKQGDQESLAYLLEKYKNLVNIKVSKYFMIGAEKEDILQEGMIGLFKAIKDFKEENRNHSNLLLILHRETINSNKSSNRQKHMPLNSIITKYGCL
ncbi:MAG: sigma factor [Clostridia bacterium]